MIGATGLDIVCYIWRLEVPDADFAVCSAREETAESESALSGSTFTATA